MYFADKSISSLLLIQSNVGCYAFRQSKSWVEGWFCRFETFPLVSFSLVFPFLKGVKYKFKHFKGKDFMIRINPTLF